ncbi:MAG: hypothetical protein DI626_00745 [Micavibrio aeruginosavorus]|uniref:CDP-alcohol phosphatidyltransferase family protein n=1 Tax=Micavibrio aeruginosavorus TaxID=349221 RepID=A0A2W5C0I7_9BACT|nr:MAG: hypothetical protein DI626_00745 [Micavibrio aeruginosavorus]
MLDTLLKKPFGGMVDAVASKVAQGGFGANKLTLSALVIGLIGCFAVAMGQFMLGLILLLINRLIVALAASVARENGITARGSYLELLGDAVVFGGFVFFFALAEPQHLMAAAFILFSYMILAAAYLGLRLFGQDDAPGSLIGRTEITIFMALGCFFPAAFSAIALFFGLFVWVGIAFHIKTAIQKL